MNGGDDATLSRLLAAAPEGVPETGPLGRLRDAGRREILESGLPTPRQEAWKYTNLNPIRKVAWDGPGEAGAGLFDAESILPAVDGYRVVLLNGRFDPVQSQLVGLPKGARVQPLPEAAADSRVAEMLGSLIPVQGTPLAALNAAHLDDGVLVRLDANCTLDKPLHVISVAFAGSAPVAGHPRLLVDLGAGAEAVIVESHVGLAGEATLTNIVSETFMGETARLYHYRVQEQPDDGFCFTTAAVSCADKSVYDGFTLSLGGGMTRNDARLILDGERIEAQISGAYLGLGDTHIENTTLIDHRRPNSVSREVFKGVLAGRSRGVFQGKILVRQEAQNTDGHQLNKALLLSDKAEADSKPELEIYADDVRCSHGATTGALEEDQLFYLRARGIDVDEARSLLVKAFVSEPIDAVQNAAMRDALHGALDTKLDLLFEEVSQ